MGIRFLAVVAFSGALSFVGCGGDRELNNQGATTFKGSITSISANSTMTINDNGQARVFEIGAAQVASDSDSELSPGKIVKVEGSHDGNNGHADKIEYDSDVEGIVTAVTLAADGSVSMLMVMGQNVVVDEMTMYGDGLSSAEDILVDELIEVSGIFQDDGSILAKHIEYKIHGDIEIKGLVANLVVAGDITTFDIGACSITVLADTEFSGMSSAADLLEGIEVEVHSSAEPGAGMIDMTNGCQVIASKVELEDAHEDKMQFDYEKGEVVSDLVDGKFTIKVMHDLDMMTEIIILVDADTAFPNGTEADIVIGTMLYVHGNYDVDGSLVAKEIEFKTTMDEPAVAMGRFDAYVDAVDAAASTIIVLGQTIMVTDMTMIDGHTTTSPVKDEPAPVVMGVVTDIPASMTLADIAMGDYVQIRFGHDGAGGLVALKIIVEKDSVLPSGELFLSEIHGRVSAVDAATDGLSIEGVAVSGVSALLPELVLDAELVGAEAFAIGMFAEDTFTAKELRVHVPLVVVVEPIKTEPVKTEPVVVK